jgi:hypothetical protein
VPWCSSESPTFRLLSLLLGVRFDAEGGSDIESLFAAAAAVRRRWMQLRPSSDDDGDDSAARGAVHTPFPCTSLAVVVVTGWEGRRMGGRQYTPVWWLRICTVLPVRSGRMVTSFSWVR